MTGLPIGKIAHIGWLLACQTAKNTALGQRLLTGLTPKMRATAEHHARLLVRKAHANCTDGVHRTQLRAHPYY